MGLPKLGPELRIGLSITLPLIDEVELGLAASLVVLDRETLGEGLLLLNLNIHTRRTYTVRP